MIIAGPVVALADLLYRAKRGERRWLHPHSGGNLFFVPVWVLGVLWFVLGIVYTVQGRS